MIVTPIQHDRSLVAIMALALAVVLSTACKPESEGRTSDAIPEATKTPVESTRSPAPKPQPSPKANEHQVTTTSGGFFVFYRIGAPSGSIPLNEMFAMNVRVQDANRQPLGPKDIELRVDAAMPQHGHGMNTTPRTQSSDGGFQVSGMLFHMPGDWQIYFDVTRDGTTDRATVDISLE